MPPINFRSIESRHLTPEGLPELQDMWREAIDAINNLQGVHGPIKLLNHIDMNGNRVMNVGSPPANVTTDALSQKAADPMYSTSTQQAAMEAVGVKMLQTTRRLNDGTQQHRISSDLNAQGTIPPTALAKTTYTATATTVTFSFPAIQFGDQSIVAVRNTLTVTGLTNGTQYLFYLYYDTKLGIGAAVADSVNAVGVPPVAFPSTTPIAALTNAAQVQNADGHIPFNNGAIQATPSGGGSGGGGGSGCIRAGMVVESRCGIVAIEGIEIGEEIRSRRGWTRVIGKRTGSDSVFLRMMLSNGEVVYVTPTHPLALFSGIDKQAGQISLADLLVAVKDEKARPAQIMEMSTLLQAGRTVLLSCDPDHEYLIGSFEPCIVAHNFIPNKGP